MVKWIRLEDFKCPSCPSGRGGNWLCADDQNHLYINERGMLESQSGDHTGQILKWRWNCGSSYHNGQFLHADREGFTFALSQARHILETGGSDWINSLITELGRQEDACIRKDESFTNVTSLRASVPGIEYVADASYSSQQLAYIMDKNPRGTCLIISIENFTNEFEKRLGTKADVEALTTTFRDFLGFNVIIKDDSHDPGATTDLLVPLSAQAKANHSKYNIFVCAILTHGDKSTVYGKTGTPTDVEEIKRLFYADRCESLAGKPKVFFIQACQGENKMKGFYHTDSALGSQMKTEVRRKIQTSMPVAADMLIGYSTVPGFVSARHPEYGSIYIQTLCKKLQELSNRHDLVSILTEVSSGVAGVDIRVKGDVDDCKQMAYFSSTLTKKLYLKGK